MPKLLVTYGISNMYTKEGKSDLVGNIGTLAGNYLVIDIR